MLLKYGAKLEGGEKGVHINDKGTKMHYNKSPKESLYYFHTLRVKKKSDMNILIYGNANEKLYEDKEEGKTEK